MTHATKSVAIVLAVLAVTSIVGTGVAIAADGAQTDVDANATVPDDAMNETADVDPNATENDSEDDADANESVPEDPGNETVPEDPGNETVPEDPGNETVPDDPGNESVEDDAGNESVSANATDGLDNAREHANATLPVVDGTQVQDLDGDGAAEDLNGNGEVDADDAVTLFMNMEDPAVQNNATAFDHNNNSNADFGDVVELAKGL